MSSCRKCGGTGKRTGLFSNAWEVCDHTSWYFRFLELLFGSGERKK